MVKEGNMFLVAFWISLALAVVGVGMDIFQMGLWWNLLFVPIVLCFSFTIVLIWGMVKGGM